MEWGAGLQIEARRIQSKLGDYLPASRARDVVLDMLDVALDIDQDIRCILKDPRVQRNYDYDGQVFSLRGTGQFHTAFDGPHLLQSIEDSMVDAFFRETDTDVAVHWFLDELDKHRWVAKRRRLNWEHSGTLGLLTEETIREVLRLTDHCRRS